MTVSEDEGKCPHCSRYSRAKSSKSSVRVGSGNPRSAGFAGDAHHLVRLVAVVQPVAVDESVLQADDRNRPAPRFEDQRPSPPAGFRVGDDGTRRRGDRAPRRLRPSREPTTETADRRCRRAPAQPAPRDRNRRSIAAARRSSLARSARATSPRARHCASDGARSCQPAYASTGVSGRARAPGSANSRARSRQRRTLKFVRGPRPTRCRCRRRRRVRAARAGPAPGTSHRSAAPRARTRCGRKPRPPRLAAACRRAGRSRSASAVAV